MSGERNIKAKREMIEDVFMCRASPTGLQQILVLTVRGTWRENTSMSRDKLDSYLVNIFAKFYLDTVLF